MRKRTPDEPRESSLASGWTIEAADPATTDAGAGSPGPDPDPDLDADTETDLDAEAPQQLSNAALVFLGVLGGVYLLYAWIWLSWAQSFASFNAQAAGAAGSLGGALQQFVIWLAPLAPILWFAAAVLMNRGSFKKTVLWVLIGALLLLPLPVFSGVGA